MAEANRGPARNYNVYMGDGRVNSVKADGVMIDGDGRLYFSLLGEKMLVCAAGKWNFYVATEKFTPEAST